MAARNELIRLDIDGLEVSDEGAGYGFVNGRRVRVDGTLPGERVEVRLTEARAGHLVGELAGILRPSPHRVPPRCPFFGPCGGCTWQHIAYPEQLRLKERMLQALLAEAIRGAAPVVRPMLTGAGRQWGYRNKVHFVLGSGGRSGAVVLGHYRRGSQSVVEVDQCPVHAAEGNRIAFDVRDALARGHVDGATADGRNGLARHVVVRVTEAPGVETLATLVVTRNDRRLRPIVKAMAERTGAPDGLAVNVNDEPGPLLFGQETRHVHGRRRVRETVGGVSFLISPTAFFQTNVRAAEAMVGYVLDRAGDARTALDLYAGAGLFALPLARRGVRVVAVEDNRAAIEDGEASRQFNRIPEAACVFVRARAEQVAGRRRKPIPASADLVVLDPPRAGCPPPVLDWICRALRPLRIVYVSCNPRALARDLRTVAAGGYRVHEVQPVDMFPHTAHIETVALLLRDRAKPRIS